MRHEAQGGATLVELLVAMTISAIVLVGLGGVFMTANIAYTSWSSPFLKAQPRAEQELLAVTMQQDGSRYVFCSTQPYDTAVPPGPPFNEPRNIRWALYFCDPDGQTERIRYTSSIMTAKWRLGRLDVARSVTQFWQGLPGRPSFTIYCPSDWSVSSGQLDIAGLNGLKGSDLRVYFQGPKGC